MNLSINNSKFNILLESISKDHLKKTYEWISDPNFRKEFMVRGNISWESHENYFHDLLHNPSKQGYAVFLDHLHVGNCGFKYIDNLNRNAELWLYLGNPEVRSIGLGGYVLSMLLKRGVDDFGLKNIYVHVAENNKAAVNLYKKNNFFQQGDCSAEWKDRDFKILRMNWRAL
jgi:RimJ/RimL family protein N-acetyltransferase